MPCWLLITLKNGNRKDKIFIHLLLCIQPTQNSLRVCLHRGGGPQIGEVTCGRSQLLSCKRDQIKMRDYMDRRDTPPNRVNSPTWGEVESPSPPLHLNKPLESTWNPQISSPLPLHPLFLLSSQLSRRTRAVKLAMKAG